MGLLDDIRGLLTPKPAVVPNPFDRQANAAIPIMGASEILPNMVGRMTGSPMAEFAAGFLSPSSWIKQPKKLDIFIGKGAKTWDTAKAAKASDMEKAGVDRATIWKETGTWKGPDKQWRQEIPDNEITLKNIPIAKDWETFFKEKEINKYGSRGAQVSEMKGDSFSAFKKFRADAEKEFNDHNKTHRNINEILHHEALINSYPELEKTSVMWNPNIGKSGEYSRGTISFGDATNESGLKSLFGHELQHAVQQREGFARGGSPEAMRSFLAPDPSLQSAYSQAELYDAYRRLAGEAEARLTQARMGMTQAERMATPPWSMYDVPESQQIVRFGDGPAMSTGRPRNHLGQEIPPTPYELAHAEAQRVAALPVEQGGLGLPPDNTYIDRAKAMGSDTDSYHGTTKSFSEFDPMKRGTASDSGWYGDADYSTPSTEFANAFAVPNGATIPQEGANVMPLKINLGNTYKWRDLADDNGRGLWQNDRNSSIEMRRKLQQEGYDSTTVENSTIKLGENENLTQEQWNALVNKSPIVGMLGKEKIEGLMRNGYDFDTFAKSYGYDVARKMPAQKTVSEYGIFDPKNIRSRFAAFNPAKRDSADLLAGLAPWALPVGATLLGGSFLLPPEEY